MPLNENNLLWSLGEVHPLDPAFSIPRITYNLFLLRAIIYTQTSATVALEQHQQSSYTDVYLNLMLMTC